MQQPPPLPRLDAPTRGVRSGARFWKYLSPEELRSLKNLFFAARVIVEGAYAGRHKSPYKGSAAEFVDYREYYPGDEIRSIDWKAFARSDRYYVKLFERETDMNCHLLVDRSASMGYGGKEFNAFFPTKELSKLEYASYLAAALAYLMVKQGDRVSLTLFDERVSAHVPSGSTFPHLYSILNLLEAARVGRKTSVARVLRDTFALHRRRGLLVIIEYLLAEPEAIFQALDMYRHRKFEIILFHVLHRYEIDLPPLDSVNFIDAETGETISTRPGDIARSYKKELDTFVNTMAASAQARNIDYNFINTTTPYHDVLQKYLLRRGTL